MISFKYVKEFLISTINRQFLFTCYLIFKKMVNYIYKFINSSHFLRAGTIIELHEVIFHSDYLVTSLFGYQISFGYMLTVICRFDDHIHLKNYMMLFDALWLDLEFILYFCASGCNFVYETSEIRHSFNPVMSKETMTQVNISGR